MSCEIYNTLTDFRFIDVTNEPGCRFEKKCPKTCEACKFGDLLIAVDLDSKDKAITDEDRAQSRELAKLEAEAASKRTRHGVTSEEILERNKTLSCICISRAN